MDVDLMRFAGIFIGHGKFLHMFETQHQSNEFFEFLNLVERKSILFVFRL